MLTSYFIISVLIGVFYAIYKELIRPAFALLGAVLVFTLTGIIEANDILTGFSNPSIASVILLILITSGLRKNFDIEYYLDRIFRHASSYRGFLIRMMAQVAVLSSIVNNTPVVALMTPYVFRWGKKHQIAPSKLLIPLSYATIMGGMITLIGTSTTLVLQGFLLDFGQSGLSPMHLLVLGAAVTVTGILFLAFAGNKLLPDHGDPLDEFEQNAREFLAETTLPPNSPLIGQSIAEAGLRNLKGVYLVEIVRREEKIYPVEPAELIEPDDILIFAGNTEDIVDLVKSRKGIELPKQAQKLETESVNVVEAVMASNSSLLGKKIKETDFRNRYDAAIIAVHRNGERISGKIGEVELRQGDLLLLYGGKEFEERTSIYRDIFVISQLRAFNQPTATKRWGLFAIAVLAIFFLVIGIVPLFTSLLAIFAFMVGLKFINLQDIKRELDLNLILLLVFSLVIGEAIINTDTGSLVAHQMVSLLQPYGTIPVLVGLLLFTTLLSSFITNVGAISIAFPLAYAISNELKIDGTPLYLGIAYAASAAFLTPIGYQTNLIVYGPGGYTFGDFFKVGLPVTIIYLSTVTIALALMFPEIIA